MNAGVIMKRSREASLQPKVVVLKIIKPLSKRAEKKAAYKAGTYVHNCTRLYVTVVKLHSIRYAAAVSCLRE